LRHLTTAVHAARSGSVVLGALRYVGWAEHVEVVGQTLAPDRTRDQSDLLANPTLSFDPDTAERIFELMLTRPEIK
jgi:hypothetical protein